MSDQITIIDDFNKYKNFQSTYSVRLLLGCILSVDGISIQVLWLVGYIWICEIWIAARLPTCCSTNCSRDSLLIPILNNGMEFLKQLSPGGWWLWVGCCLGCRCQWACLCQARVSSSKSQVSHIMSHDMQSDSVGGFWGNSFLFQSKRHSRDFWLRQRYQWCLPFFGLGTQASLD